ncbi:MAG: sulfotransferase domain-containing protein [Rhodospirillales bacterium]
MTQILWLASFPKSGNTWLRAFLANYLRGGRLPEDVNKLPNFSYGDMRIEYYEQISGRKAEELDYDTINRLRPRVHRFLAEAHPGLVLVKTHSILSAIEDVPTITPDVTFGAVYVVRNPFDVAVSFGHHYGLSTENAVKAICYKGLETVPTPGHILQVLSDWSTHLKGWLEAPGLYRHLMRYEDMTRSPTRTFGGVLDFLKVARDRERLKRAIRHSSFNVLSGQERQSGFVERSRTAERFFRKGEVGGWRRELTPAQVDFIVQHHREAMTSMGYLSAEGEILV